MIVVSWNVNSLPARMPRVLELLDQLDPDVVCLQETKVRTETFPHLELQMAGYVAVEHSSGGRNGVAVLARSSSDIGSVTTGLPGEPEPSEARWVEAVVDGVHVVSVYVPNGRSLDDPVFPAKLQFLDRMVERMASLAEAPALVAGDFNIAPSDIDVHDPVRFIGTTHTSTRERAAIGRMESLGFADMHRSLHPEQQRFTWWDYRGGNFHKDLGMRIDLFMASPSLVGGRSCSYDIARDFRKGAKPSDHAPIVLRIAP